MNHGSVVRGWLGVQIQSVSQDIADSLGLKDAAGAIVGEVSDGSPAAKMGFKIGDVITAVNGKQVKDSRDLALTISQMNPGAQAKITYWRDGASHDANVTLGTLPTTDQMASNDNGNNDNGGKMIQPSTLKDLGMTLSPDNNNKGVVISDVDPTGAAAANGLETGDVIISVGNKSVSSPADVEKMVADAKANGQKAVLLYVKSGSQPPAFVALPFAKT
jgi:serine protease Do